MSNQIKKRVKNINKKMYELTQELKNIQNACTHEDAEHIDRADTGNYDRSLDRYWTNHTCFICGKSWTTDQNWNKE